jgi:hypothetical protein
MLIQSTGKTISLNNNSCFMAIESPFSTIIKNHHFSEVKIPEPIPYFFEPNTTFPEPNPFYY